MSMDRLLEKIAETKNPTVAGLDPKLDYVPNYIKEKYFAEYGYTLKAAAEALLEFNKGLIDELYDIVPAVKPQAAYYEMYGTEGVIALQKTIEYAKSKDMFVITDGKRNDIGTTMEAYATAHLGKVKVGDKMLEPFGADALTVNGYLGTDGIAPLIKVCKEYDKGIFVLVKTSNKSSGELQDKSWETKPFMKQWARCAKLGARTQEENTATAQSARLSAQPIRNSSRSFVRKCLTQSSWFPVTAHRVAEQKM